MVEKVPDEAVSSYGIVDIGGKELQAGESEKINTMVEKPKVEEAPSRYAVVGRYVLPAEIWSLFKRPQSVQVVSSSLPIPSIC